MDRNEKGEDLNGSDDDQDDDRKMPAVDHPNHPSASQTAYGVNNDDDDDDDDGTSTMPSESQDGVCEASAVDETELDVAVGNSSIYTEFLDALFFPDDCIDNSQCGLLEELPQEGDGASKKAKLSTEVAANERSKGVLGGGVEDVMALLSQDPKMGPVILRDTLARYAPGVIDDRQLIAVVRLIVGQMPSRVYYTFGEFREEFLTRLNTFCLLEQSQRQLLVPRKTEMCQGSFQWEAFLTHLRLQWKEEPTAKKGDNNDSKTKRKTKGTKHMCRTCFQPREGHVCTGPPVIPVETKDCKTQTDENWKTKETSDSFEVGNVEETEKIVDTEAVVGGEECKEEIVEPECNEAEVEDISTEATVIEEAENGGVDGPKEDQPASKDKKKEE
jgi:hypothetical protein